MKVEIKIVNAKIGSKIPMPAFATDGSAAVDLRVCLNENQIDIEPNTCKLLGTGIAINLADKNTCAVIAPRSGLGHKKGIILGNAVGIIDADYQGELMISCWNRSSEIFQVKDGDRIAQLLFLPIKRPEFHVVESFEENTERGELGFGSTGVT